MMRRVAACAALLLTVPAAAGAATLAQLDAWLATSPIVIRRAAPPDAASVDPGFAKRARYVIVPGADGRSGWVTPDDVTDGFLADGQRVMAVPINSGGSGGVFMALLFTQIGGTTRFVGTIPSPDGHLSVSVNGGHLVIQTPIPGGGANCCPWALHFERATLHGIRLVSEDQWDLKLAH
jgi:hypothetical protein